MPRSRDLAIFMLINKQTLSDRWTDRADCFIPCFACARGVKMSCMHDCYNLPGTTKDMVALIKRPTWRHVIEGFQYNGDTLI